jgi:hydrogenase expression/formation protein HypC
MCLGIPGRIVSLEEAELRSGRVDFGGVVKSVCLAFTPEAALGDWVIVHAGFAISRLDPAAAEATLAYLAELGDLGERAP